MLAEYLPILIFLAIAIALSVVMLSMSYLIAPQRPDAEKLSPYECGFEAFSDARGRFDIRFYLVTLLFIIFDLEIAFLFPWRTVLGNVTFGLEVQGIGKRRGRKTRALELLRQVGLEEFAEHYRHELSGGLRQRVNIVRTLACDPKVILMDEPFGPLDAQTRLQLQAMLLDLWGQREGITIIFITHDLGEAIALADRVVVMSIRPGRIREIVPVNFPRPRDVYSIHTQPDFRELYDQLWWHLAEEMKGSAG